MGNTYRSCTAYPSILDKNRVFTDPKEAAEHDKDLALSLISDEPIVTFLTLFQEGGETTLRYKAMQWLINAADDAAYERRCAAREAEAKASVMIERGDDLR